jgi:hypothetical protein
MHSYSQNLFTEKLQWNLCDSIVTFQFKDQIIEWSKERLPFPYVYSAEEFCIKGCNIYIVTVAGCSGLPCVMINIFKENEGFWKFIRDTRARLANITIKVEEIEEKIIFETELKKRILVSTNEEKVKKIRRKKKNEEKNIYIYETTLKRIGELPFELILNSD